MRTYKPVHKGISIVGAEAFQDYRKWSKIRDPKKFNYYSDYRKIARKIWKKVAISSTEFESGTYSKGFFYLIPQVIDNKVFIKLPNGKIKSNSYTNGDIYAPIFCNILDKLNYFCWSLDGNYFNWYKALLKNRVDAEVPRYYFILPTLIANKF